MGPLTASTWCYRCARCGTWASTLHVGINGDAHHQLDEDLRETGLARLREQNNATVLDRLTTVGLSSSQTVLDVGAAHGWFVGAARDRGFRAEGIEPDDALATRARANGTSVRAGFFPDVLGADERVDAICFNDVLEHIPDVRLALTACYRHLSPGGLLSINIPNSRGLVYRVALLARRLSMRGLFDRLWQVGLPSPHLWYFDEAGISALCAAAGMKPVFAGRLPSLTRRGLWERAHEDRRPSAITVVGVLVAWIAAPVLNNRFASDIMHVIARKPVA